MLKQNLLIATVISLCWIVGYWWDNYNYFPLWLTSLLLTIVIGPIVCLQLVRIKKDKNIEKINKIFRIINWVFIFLFLMPLFANLLFEIKLMFVHYSEFNYFSFYYYFIGYEINDILNLILYILPYFIISGLLYWSVVANKQLKNSNLINQTKA